MRIEKTNPLALAEAIRLLGRKSGPNIETWMSIGLALTLSVVGGVIFWRTKLVMKEVSIEFSDGRLQALFTETLLPFLALSVGSFLILIVTVLTMRFMRLRLDNEKRQAQISDLVTRLIGQYHDEYFGRISSWLHDGVGHGLVMQKMDLEYMRKQGLLNDQDSVRLLGQLSDLIQQARSMASMIYPQHMFEFGIRSALDQLLENFEGMSHIVVVNEIENIDEFCYDELALLVYRIVQESLTNVAKHAHATRVRVRISCDGERLAGSIINNGKPYEKGVHAAGIGLMVLTERAKRLGGEVLTSADVEWSYRLSFSFPVKG